MIKGVLPFIPQGLCDADVRCKILGSRLRVQRLSAGQVSYCFLQRIIHAMGGETTLRATATGSRLKVRFFRSFGVRV